MSQDNHDLDIDLESLKEPVTTGTTKGLELQDVDLDNYLEHPAYGQSWQQPAQPYMPRHRALQTEFVADPNVPVVHKVKFTGEGGEFFRMWIVDTFLTFVTLGIYAAWAKVRAQQYFYGHTLLNGYNLGYLAKPIPILKGNLIIGAFAIAYSLVGQLTGRPELALILLAMFGLAYPFLVYSTLRFRASTSSYRGVRFAFHGTLWESYKVYGLTGLVVGGSFLVFVGLLYFLLTTSPRDFQVVISNIMFAGLVSTLLFMAMWPWVVFQQRKYMFSNLAWGSALSRFKGRWEDLYSICFRPYAVGFLGIAAICILASWILSAGRPAETAVVLVAVVATLLAVISIGPVILWIDTYTRAKMMQYFFEHTQLDKRIKISSDINIGEFFWLRLLNQLALSITYGLAGPWVRVRYAKFVLQSISITVQGDLDDVAAGKLQKEGVLGDAAADYWNIEIGF
jgi:uncharacterized membrane protein YjgN (DUF898 family)